MKNKLINIIKNNKIWFVFLIALVCFFSIAEDVFTHEIMSLDVMAYKLIVENLRNDMLTKIMQVITEFSGVFILIAIAIVSLILVDKKKISIAICSNLVIITLLNIVLKNIVQRPRPDGYRLILEGGYSFPSGHSMVCTAFYGLIIYFIYTNVKNKNLKYTLCVLLGMLIPLIAFSRVYLGVHYASDVLAGFLLSIAYLIYFITLYNSINVKPKVIKRFARVKNKKLINSFKYAVCGLKTAYKREQNLKIHVSIMCLVIIAGIAFKISPMEWIICLIMFALVISEELINTSIETVVDMVMPQQNQKAKNAKDIAASAVFITSIVAVITGLIIFLPKVCIM